MPFLSLFKKKEPPKPKEKKKSGDENWPVEVKRDVSEEFTRLGRLGKGTFGEVFLVQSRTTKQRFALKVIEKRSVLSHGRVKDLFCERSVLRKAKHPFIVQLHRAFQSQGKLYFLMEYLPAGDLEKRLCGVSGKRLDEQTAKLYAAELVMALEYLHEHNIIYRDLKPQNILLDAQGHACLSDFGLSKVFDEMNPEKRASSFVGSPLYVAPDVLRNSEYGPAVDWWGLGVLLFRMLVGRPPFLGGNMRQIFDNILYEKVNVSQFSWVSDEAKDLMLRLLQKDESKRLPGAAVKEHVWFRDINWSEVYTKKCDMGEPPEVGKLDATGADGEVSSCFSPEGTSGSGRLNTAQQEKFAGFTCSGGRSNSNPAANVRSPEDGEIRLSVSDSLPHSPNTPGDIAAPDPEPEVSNSPAGSEGDICNSYMPDGGSSFLS